MPSLGRKRTLLLVELLFFSIAMIGCDNPLNGLRDMFTSESGKWRELAQIQAQGAIRAVPGERLLEAIDAVHGTDEAKKKEAQGYLLRLADIDRDSKSNWRATVTFGFDEKNKLHADGFWGFSESRAQVEYFVQDSFSPTDVVSTNYRMQTMDELNTEIDTKVDSFLVTLQGTAVDGPNLGDNGMFKSVLLTWPNSLTPNLALAVDMHGASVQKPKILNDAKDTRDKAAKTLKELFKAQFAKKEIPVGAATLTIAWHPEEAKNLFFILIPESDWLAHQNDKEPSIEVNLHRENDLHDTFQGFPPFKVNLQQFKDREPVELRFGGGKVRWAVVDPTRNSASLPDLSPDKIKNMENLLHLVNAVNAGTGNIAGPIPPPKKTVALLWVMLATILILLTAIVFLLFQLRK